MIIHCKQLLIDGKGLRVWYTPQASSALSNLAIALLKKNKQFLTAFSSMSIASYKALY